LKNVDFRLQCYADRYIVNTCSTVTVLTIVALQNTWPQRKICLES